MKYISILQFGRISPSALFWYLAIPIGWIINHVIIPLERNFESLIESINFQKDEFLFKEFIIHSWLIIWWDYVAFFALICLDIKKGSICFLVLNSVRRIILAKSSKVLCNFYKKIVDYFLINIFKANQSL